MRSTSRNIICEKQPSGGGRRAVFLCREGSFAPRRRVRYLSPTGIISRLRARDGEFRAPARVTFFFCKKKVTKENHSNLRFKDPLARGGQVQIWRCVLAGGVQRSSLSVKRTVPAFTGAEASATACLSHGRGVCFYRVGDYQIAPIAARSTAMGRWRLTPPGYGDAACGRGMGRFVPRHE